MQFGGIRSLPIKAHCAGLIVLLAACGQTPDVDPVNSGSSEGPEWHDLARGFEPKDLGDVAQGWNVEGDTPVEVDDQGIVWVVRTIVRDDWHPDDHGREGAWYTERPWMGGFACAGNGELRLEADGQAFDRRPGHGERLVPGLCYIDEERIYITIEVGAEPAAETTFAMAADQGESVDGTWRVPTLDHVGAGIPVHIGHAEDLTLTIPPASALRFYTVFEHLPFGMAPGSAGETPTARFRVRLNGDVIFDAIASVQASTHVIQLPSAGVPDARLSFELDSGNAARAGMGVFYAPVIGPSEVGDYRARPSGDERPNIVLFIADTFRADNMALYGGRAELSPNLNRFAEGSLRFLQARSTSSWTLPSISSIMTGLFPPQHGATEHELTVARSITTVAESLRAAGYRTAAVTDSGYFSPPFGLDQGFDLFVENRIHMWHLTKTIDQALRIIDHDDGRPLFLVVHTYRVHGPFREGPDENQDVFNAFLEKCQSALSLQGLRIEERRREVMPYVDEWVAMYERGVVDMDVKFERFRREIEQRGLLDTGYLAFTGDHGQAHGENEDIAHGGKLWESKLRIPMLIQGRGLEPGDVAVPVSLVDWAPTFGELAGIERHPDWIGTSLLSPPTNRPTYAFRLEGKRGNEVTIQAGARKVSALPDPEALRSGVVAEAFDLSVDAGELDNRMDSEWAKEIARESADAIEFFLRAKASATDSEVSADLKKRLAEIGYGGSE